MSSSLKEDLADSSSDSDSESPSTRSERSTSVPLTPGHSPIKSPAKKKPKNVTFKRLNVSSQTEPPTFPTFHEKVRYSLAAIYGDEAAKEWDVQWLDVKKENRTLRKSVADYEGRMKGIARFVFPENVTSDVGKGKAKKEEKFREKRSESDSKEKGGNVTSNVGKKVDTRRVKRCTGRVKIGRKSSMLCPWIDRHNNASHHWLTVHETPMPDRGWGFVELTEEDEEKLDAAWQKISKERKAKK